MNNIRLAALRDSHSAIARKVLGYVPINEAWDAKQIRAAIARDTRASIDPKTVDGCLNSLVESGVVKESRRGMFQQVPFKDSSERGPIEIEVEIKAVKPPMAKAPEPAAPADPLDRLGAAAQALRGIGQSLVDVADEIENAGLAMAEIYNKAQSKNLKLVQLHALLKDLGQ